MTALRDAARLLLQIAGALTRWTTRAGDSTRAVTGAGSHGDPDCADCANHQDEVAATRCRDLCDDTTCEHPYDCWRTA